MEWSTRKGRLSRIHALPFDGGYALSIVPTLRPPIPPPGPRKLFSACWRHVHHPWVFSRADGTVVKPKTNRYCLALGYNILVFSNQVFENFENF